MKRFLFTVLCKAVIGVCLVAAFVGSSGDADAFGRRCGHRCGERFHRLHNLFHRHAEPCCEPPQPAPAPVPPPQAKKMPKAKRTE